MKNKIIFAVMLLLFPLTTYANKIELECPKEIAPQSEFVCQIRGSTDMKITGISAKVRVSKSLEIISVITDAKWQGDGKDGDIKIFIDPEITGDFNIGSIKLKTSGENNNIYIGSIILYDENVKGHNLESISKSIKINSKIKENENPIDDANSNYLVDIEIEDYNLDFYKQNNDYELKIGNETELDIKPTLEDDSATYEIVGNKNLKNGSKIKINVTSKDGSKSTYTIKIVKEGIGKKMTLVFAIIIFILALINLVRILLKRRRGKENEKQI